ncbi:MAG: YitT family protein [Mycoplasma sp.]|nr:YitT family protein [Candidatus Hennigella equi]
MKIKNKRTDFNFGKYELRHLHAKPIPFSKLYLNKSVPFKYVVAALCGIIFAFLTTCFIKNTGAFSYGLSSFLQGIAKLCNYFITESTGTYSSMIYSALFWGLLLIGNIPLFVFAWCKVGHRFALLTLTFLISNSLSGFVFDFIPGIEGWSLFGNTTLWCAQETSHSEWIHVLTEKYHIQVLPFSVPEALAVDYHPSNYVKPLLLILSTVTYAFIASFVFAILFIVGGSTAGTDIISVYLAAEKKKNVGTFFLALNLIMITLASAIGTFIPASLACPECRSVEFFFNANWLGTLISMLIFTAIYKRLYPNSRRCKVEVYSKKAKQIRDLLYKNHYVHGSSLADRIGGYSNKKQQMFITICSATELPMIIDQINTIDKLSTITISNLYAVDGPFALQRQGSR